jgi:hypothetical protein
MIALPAAFVEEHDVEAAPTQKLQHRETRRDVVLVTGAQQRVSRHEFDAHAARGPIGDHVGGLREALLVIDQPGIDIGDSDVVARLRQSHRKAGVGGADAAVLEQPVKLGGDETDTVFSVGRRGGHARIPRGSRRALSPSARIRAKRRRRVSASAIGRIAPWRRDQRHVVMRGRIGDGEADRNLV